MGPDAGWPLEDFWRSTAFNQLQSCACFFVIFGKRFLFSFERSIRRRGKMACAVCSTVRGSIGSYCGRICSQEDGWAFCAALLLFCLFLDNLVWQEELSLYSFVIVGVLVARVVFDANFQPLDGWWQPGLGIASACSIIFVVALFLRDYAISRSYRQLLEGKV